MAIAFVKNGGTTTNKALGGTSTTITVPAGGHAAGDLLAVACYGFATLTVQLTSVTDVRGNTYSLEINSNKIGIGASVLTTALQAGDLITIAWNIDPSPLAVVAKEFSGVSDTQDVTGASTLTSTANTTPSATITPVSPETLVLGAVGTNGPSGDTLTEDTDTTGGAGWTALRVGSTGGGATSNATLNFVHKITTSATTQTYNPTITSRLWREVLIALQPAAVAATPPRPTIIQQAVQRAAVR